MSGYVSKSLYNAIRRRNRANAIAAAEQGKSFQVVRVTKKGKRTPRKDAYGVSRFDQQRAIELCEYWTKLNPTMKFEVEPVE